MHQVFARRSVGTHPSPETGNAQDQADAGDRYSRRHACHTRRHRIDSRAHQAPQPEAGRETAIGRLPAQDGRPGRGDPGARSRVFIDASKDLGNGLKVFGRYAWKLNPSNGSQFGARDQYVGLKGSFGAVKFGRQPTPYKMNGGVKWDPLTATYLEARNSVAMSGGRFGHNNFLDRSLRYLSPKLGGVTIGVIRQIDYQDNKDNDPAVAPEDETTGSRQSGSWQLGAKGKWGMVEGIAVYGVQTQQKNISGGGATDAGEDSTRFKVGARFSIAKAHKIAVQYEIINNRQGGTPGGIASGINGEDRTETHGYVNWVGKFGSIMPQVGLGIYAATGESLGAGHEHKTAGTFLQAAVSWRPSKTFRVFGGLRSQSTADQETDTASGVDTFEQSATEQTFSIGIRKDF